MKRKYFYAFLLSLFFINYSFCNELISMKNKEKYSANLVYVNSKKIVFIIHEKRFEFDASEFEKIDYSNSEEELEIELDDSSVIKGTIVDQDDESLTIGSSAGITPIEKKRVKEIRNPKYKNFREPQKEYSINYHFGNIPYATFVLNDFSKSYQAFWSYESYFESNFFLKAYFGLDVRFIMLIPQFNVYNDFIFIIPINFTIKYEDNFYWHKDINHWTRKFFWHIKLGFGFAILALHDIPENKTESSVGISSEVDYGLKYYLTKIFSIGINGKTDIIVQSGSYIIMQSCGVILELKF